MNRIQVFVSGVMAGVCIATGGAAFLALENKVLGALFFVVGLFTICTFGFHLFTGKVCYVFENDRRFAKDLLWIWLGNLAGCLAVAGLLTLTRVGAAFTDKAQSMADVKLGDGLLSVFILAMFCNMLIFVAVDGFRNNPHELGKYLSLFFGVMVFILCGFEHCVANMFYISMAHAWSGRAAVFILVNTAGNAVGGWVIPVARRLMTQKKE